MLKEYHSEKMIKEPFMEKVTFEQRAEYNELAAMVRY